ncbi:iron-containing alcohol dehydrogenase [Myxococcota bacterium]
MGSGKTSVGRVLADRIGCDFADLDDVIAEEAGAPIREIFRNHGGVGFQARERAALRNVLGRGSPAVLATGGGTFIDPTMREWIRQAGRTIYLQASPEVLVARINEGQARLQRPLPGGPDPQQTVRRLLGARADTYEESDFTIRTDLARIEQVVEEIIGFLRIERHTPALGRKKRKPPRAAISTPTEDSVLQLGTSGSYAVHTRHQAGGWLAAEITEACKGHRIAVISDDTVASLHSDRLVADLRERGRRVTLHTVPPGEQSKGLTTAAALYDRLLEAGIGRGDAIVALGGGMIMDLAGFVASTYLRGIPFTQVPTTTLAAVDASVGGETAVSTPQSTNLVGTVHPPRAVLVAIAHLATQEPRAHAAGLVAALKIAATRDASFFDALAMDAPKLLAYEPEPLLLAIRRAIALKAAIVARNVESDDRLALSFGHTIGHAIEVAEGFGALPAEAVALGMVAECEWAESEGIGPQVRQQIETVLAALELPIDWRSRMIDPAAIGGNHIGRAASVRLPHIPQLGSFQIRTVPLAALVEFVRRRRNSCKQP